ncbi:MAG: hypothetical protein ACI8PZ_001293 [Myxococcota bacterium]|jgi:hypothetical protein
MHQLLRIAALAAIFFITSAAWLLLGGVMSARTSDQQSSLHGAVADLWGQPLVQRAPSLTFSWTERVSRDEAVLDREGRPVVDTTGQPVVRRITTDELRRSTQTVARTDITADLSLDQRRKGLMWFALYDVRFDGSWQYVHEEGRSGSITFTFPFPVSEGVYDDFVLLVDGEPVDAEPVAGAVAWTGPVSLGDALQFQVGYASRGLDEWSYRPTDGVGRLRDFELALTTDFADIDYPSFTISPSQRQQTDTGWQLDWDFESLVTGHGMGMVMPTRIQPGPLAASMAFSAPISLALYMGLLTVLGLVRGQELHPMNHVFLAGAFFAFHLLFGYTADHLPVEWAFTLSSVVSLFLTISYLRLVAGPRFAIVQSGLAQLVYLVGFALAHFFEGFTGLTVTVLGIGTLFVLMQATGRTKWTDVFARSSSET